MKKKNDNVSLFLRHLRLCNDAKVLMCLKEYDVVVADATGSSSRDIENKDY